MSAPDAEDTASGGKCAVLRSAVMLRLDVLTLFPEMVAGPLQHSMLGRAQRAGLVEIAVHQLRDWATDRHKTVDDYAYGGGKGMVLKSEPIFAAVEALRRPGQTVVLMDPAGERLSQALARDLARQEALLFICGHYEGVDERVRLVTAGGPEGSDGARTRSQ